MDSPCEITLEANLLHALAITQCLSPEAAPSDHQFFVRFAVSPVLDLQSVQLDTAIDVGKLASLLIVPLAPLLPMFLHASLHPT